MRRLLVLVAVAGIWCAPAAWGNGREVRIPLDRGRIDIGKLTSALIDEGLRDVHLPAHVAFSGGRLDVRGLKGALFVKAMNAAMGDGCRLSVSGDELVLHLDAQKWPHDLRGAKLAVRDFVREAAPAATQRQGRRYGLVMPTRIDGTRRLVVLVAGLDCGSGYAQGLGDLLAAEGEQVAYFSYPDDQPIAESGELLGKHLAAVRTMWPGMKVDIVAHSMGGLVARAYVEGHHYAGGVDRFIMVAPPNHGAAMARLRGLLEAREHYYLWRNDPEWSPSWAITDGLGEAGSDLKPGSRFLRQLNARPRAAGVRYTIVAGCHNTAADVASGCLEKVASAVPGGTRRWLGVSALYRGMKKGAEKLRDQVGKSDGCVTVKSTMLDGVEDWVCVPANHDALFLPREGKMPGAWEVIRDRLGVR